MVLAASGIPAMTFVRPIANGRMLEGALLPFPWVR